jgi:uncharacterized spore protein YtfJ
MTTRGQINSIVSKIIKTDWANGDTDSVDEMVHSYEELKDKCDQVIEKIKERKGKKKEN